MRGELRISANNLRTAKLCALSAFLGAQFLGAQARTPAPINQTQNHWHRYSNHEETKNTKGTGKDPLQTSLRALRFFVVCANLCSSDLAEDNCVKCHAQSTGRAEEVVRLHFSSAHGKASVGCDDCHGGDPTQADKAKAHSTNFTGKPDRGATLTVCGACHDPQLAQFKTGRHFPQKEGVPRLDCAECHGAHSVGNPPDTFSIGQFCVSCHGLEYLPPLPQQFQDLLNLSDDLRDAFARLATKGRKPSDKAIEQRKEIRRLTAEIVHTTDLKGGLSRIPHILSQGEKLKRQIK